MLDSGARLRTATLAAVAVLGCGDLTGQPRQERDEGITGGSGAGDGAAEGTGAGWPSEAGREAPLRETADARGEDGGAEGERDSASGGALVKEGGGENAGGDGGHLAAGRAGDGGAVEDRIDPGPASERPTCYVEGRHLYDPCGEKVVLKGVNHPTMYVDRRGRAIPEIARTGANAVRIVWFATHGVAIGEADEVISRTAENGMIPVLEMHDATGPGNWNRMSEIVRYWTSREAVALIAKHEKYLIVNIANEAGPDRGRDYGGFERVYRDAIATLRGAGIRTPLVVDASGWGRDYNVLLDRGPALIDADPDRNVMLSAHLYDAMSREQLARVLQQFVDRDLPFHIGEFANRSPAGRCGPEIDYRGMIAEAHRREIGWLAWSWGNDDPSTWWNGDCWEFDMTRTFAFESLERWGLEVAVTDENSLRNTSERSRFMTTGTCGDRSR